jgi:exodeoxyribonuclease III
MKIITWNCNMAFRKKAEHILAYKPDIVVVPECECPEKLIFSADVPKPTDILWFGTNKHKGLAILSYGNFKFKLLDCHNEALKMIIPIAVTGGGYDFSLFAIWAFNPGDPDGRYIEQIWKAIHLYDDLLNNKASILIGDFNSNTIWDRKHRAANHSNVVKYLADCDIHSAYHLHHQQEQGKEQHPTFYLYRNQLKPYHLDYCFLSSAIATQIQSVEIGDYDFWIKYSDHVPLIVTLA